MCIGLGADKVHSRMGGQAVAVAVLVAILAAGPVCGDVQPISSNTTLDVTNIIDIDNDPFDNLDGIKNLTRA